jgi:hypothetical protein
MYKIALVALGMGVWLVTLEAADARTRGYQESSPVYEGRFDFGPAPGFSPRPPGYSVAPYSHAGCFVTSNGLEEAKGRRHWSQWC